MSGENTPRTLVQLSYSYVMVVTFTLPVLALFLCAVMGLILHFDEVTDTHCKVSNYVPSISAVIGDLAPERYIWRVAMALFIIPRLFDGLLYHGFFRHSGGGKGPWYHTVNHVTLVLHVLQYLSLLLLSYVSSKENHAVHRNGFAGFVLFSMTHMVTFMYMFYVSGTLESNRGRYLQFCSRKVFVCVHFVAFFLSLVFYWAHNTYCWPYRILMSLHVFGILEYIVVGSNIAFHSMQYVEFRNNYHISIASNHQAKHCTSI